MRRKERELTETPDIYAAMKKCKVCSLALNGGDYPYVVPVSFGVEEEDGRFTLYFHGAGEGTKVDLMKRDSRASFCMSAEETFEMKDTACSATMRYVSVCGRGRLEEVEAADEKLKGLTCVMRQFVSDGGEFVFDQRTAERTSVFRLTVEEITGKVNRKPQ